MDFQLSPALSPSNTLEVINSIDSLLSSNRISMVLMVPLPISNDPSLILWFHFSCPHTHKYLHTNIYVNLCDTSLIYNCTTYVATLFYTLLSFCNGDHSGQTGSNEFLLKPIKSLALLQSGNTLQLPVWPWAPYVVLQSDPSRDPPPHTTTHSPFHQDYTPTLSCTHFIHTEWNDDTSPSRTTRRCTRPEQQSLCLWCSWQ